MLLALRRNAGSVLFLSTSMIHRKLSLQSHSMTLMIFLAPRLVR
jgi:hypothetical protein